ncbi:MAG: MFS transporter [Anaerolineae bacterium]
MSLFRNRSLLSLSLAHLTLDLYPSILPIMLPFLVASLHLTYTQAGLVATASLVGSSLTQPLFGYLADRFTPRILGPLGVIWTAAFIVSAAYAWSYPILLGCILLAALGSAAFHPQGAAQASVISGERRATSLALFSFGGSIGYALGPLLGGAVFSNLGLRGAALLLLPALVVLPLLLVRPPVEREERKAPLETRNPIEWGPTPWLALVSVAMIVLLRPWASMSLSIYLPLLYQSRGYTLSLASQVLFLLLISSAFGGLLNAFLADRFGPRRVLAFSLILSSPLIYLFLYAPGAWPHFLVIPLGIFLGGLVPVVTFTAQNLLSGSAAMASGFALGGQFTAGGIGAAVTGFLADRFGLLRSLELLVLLPLVAALFCLGLPRRENG